MKRSQLKCSRGYGKKLRGVLGEAAQTTNPEPPTVMVTSDAMGHYWELGLLHSVVLHKAVAHSDEQDNRPAITAPKSTVATVC